MESGPARSDEVAARLLAGCDSQQREAITSDARPLCVLAAAGSGKTRVLTRRIAWRVNEGSAAAPYVLALTFTRKAAAELRGRLSSLGLPEPVTAGTFHAVALAELRRLAAERLRPAPVVLASKARLLASAAARDVAHDRAALAELAFEIEWAQAQCLTPRDYAHAVRASKRAAQCDPDLVTEVWRRYEREKRRRGVLDFDDLLLGCARELECDQEFAASARWRFRHVFVDEYQDVEPRPGQAARRLARRQRRPLCGRRPRPGDLRLERQQPARARRLPASPPQLSGDPPCRELPLHRGGARRRVVCLGGREPPRSESDNRKRRAWVPYQLRPPARLGRPSPRADSASGRCL